MPATTADRDQFDAACWTALQAADGNASHAAQAIGTSRSTLRRAVSRHAATLAAEATACDALAAELAEPIEKAMDDADPTGEAGKLALAMRAQLAESDARVDATVAAAATVAIIPVPGDACSCRCGAPVSKGRRFARGHDGALLAKLRRAVSGGALTAAEAQAVADAVSDRFADHVRKALARIEATVHLSLTVKQASFLLSLVMEAEPGDEEEAARESTRVMLIQAGAAS